MWISIVFLTSVFLITLAEEIRTEKQVAQYDPLPLAVQNYGQIRGDNSTCSKGDLTKPFALVIQGILGILAFGILVVKRYLEPKEQRRKWLVWTFDITKQGISMIVMHILNVWLSEIQEKRTPKSHPTTGTSSQPQHIDPCTFYLTSFLLDTSVGLVVIWIGLKFFEWVIVKYDILFGLEFGNYVPDSRRHLSRIRSYSNHCDNNNSNAEVTASDSFNSTHSQAPIQLTRQETVTLHMISKRVWMLQTICYLVVTVVEKIIVYGILQLDSLEQFFYEIRILLTRWTDSKEVEIALVMLVIPFFLNCFMFWIVDNILMGGTSCLAKAKNIILKQFQKTTCHRFKNSDSDLSGSERETRPVENSTQINRNNYFRKNSSTAKKRPSNINLAAKNRNSHSNINSLVSNSPSTPLLEAFDDRVDVAIAEEVETRSSCSKNLFDAKSGTPQFETLDGLANGTCEEEERRLISQDSDHRHLSPTNSFTATKRVKRLSASLDSACESLNLSMKNFLTGTTTPHSRLDEKVKDDDEPPTVPV